eukprot:6196379-Pleurochrysis_carterae.AAC.5
MHASLRTCTCAVECASLACLCGCLYACKPFDTHTRTRTPFLAPPLHAPPPLPPSHHVVLDALAEERELLWRRERQRFHAEQAEHRRDLHRRRRRHALALGHLRNRADTPPHTLIPRRAARGDAAREPTRLAGLLACSASAWFSRWLAAIWSALNLSVREAKCARAKMHVSKRCARICAFTRAHAGHAGDLNGNAD